MTHSGFNFTGEQGMRSQLRESFDANAIPTTLACGTKWGIA